VGPALIKITSLVIRCLWIVLIFKSGNRLSNFILSLPPSLSQHDFMIVSSDHFRELADLGRRDYKTGPIFEADDLCVW
jgi:hypothetical protein